MLCCAVLCCAVLCCAVLCCAVLRCAVLCCAVLCCAVLWCAVLCCAVLCCAVVVVPAGTSTASGTCTASVHCRPLTSASIPEAEGVTKKELEPMSVCLCVFVCTLCVCVCVCVLCVCVCVCVYARCVLGSLRRILIVVSLVSTRTCVFCSRRGRNTPRTPGKLQPTGTARYRTDTCRHAHTHTGAWHAQTRAHSDTHTGIAAFSQFSLLLAPVWCR